MAVLSASQCLRQRITLSNALCIYALINKWLRCARSLDANITEFDHLEAARAGSTDPTQKASASLRIMPARSRRLPMKKSNPRDQPVEEHSARLACCCCGALAAALKR